MAPISFRTLAAHPYPKFSGVNPSRASHDEMQIDVKRYEPLTLSSRRILNCFSNSFLEFYSYEGFPSSDTRKNKA